ncbi:Putative ribonuclease Z/Hydroxyacylglutathione hydrolase [Septoria linicola]|uniref:Ribonuclease Z/Hydroxyacylglutathione hydrolase n=1 Tax=Septoria linicola TaxID=215465 RepID=A0A9Q9AQB6_9PEZI|nr:Putative ribonuclease Z/Hydroxyacylglutathione hydrolase [Septoria linicola]
MDEPSKQLHDELRHAVRDALRTRRPLLHHLNDDSSWLIQIPRPENAVKRGFRSYFNILVDPWLKGGQSDVASWFSKQFHASASAVQSIAELEDLITELELLAYTSVAGRKCDLNIEEELGREESLIDAIAISHEFTDHCHEATLLECSTRIPVFAAQEAAKLVRSWKHFQTVITLGVFGEHEERDWRATSVLPLPEWIGISRLLSKSDALYYHSAVMITWNNRHQSAQATLENKSHPKSTRNGHHATIQPDEDEDSAEAIIYTPHGVISENLRVVPNASPPISTLAFLHGLHNVRLSSWGKTALQLNLGASNGLKAQRVLHSKYWIGTHDEVKTGKGLVGFFIKREVMSVKDALEQEKKQRHNGRYSSEDAEVLQSFEGTNWLDLRNGESRVLV